MFFDQSSRRGRQAERDRRKQQGHANRVRPAGLGDGAMPPSDLRWCHPQQKGPFRCP
jgi:hypothetical protein